MVDIVANNVMSTSLTPDLSTYMFKEPVTLVALCPNMSIDMLALESISSLLPYRLD
jgi:hypothetical protein